MDLIFPFFFPILKFDRSIHSMDRAHIIESDTSLDQERKELCLLLQVRMYCHNRLILRNAMNKNSLRNEKVTREKRLWRIFGQEKYLLTLVPYT